MSSTKAPTPASGTAPSTPPMLLAQVDSLGRVFLRRLAHSAIIALLAVATWKLGVTPLKARAQQAWKGLEAARADLAESATLLASHESARSQRAATDAFIAAANAWTSAASRDTQIYDDLLKLADTHRVRVDRIDPVGDRRAVSIADVMTVGNLKNGSSRRPAQSSDASFYSGSILGFRINLTGSYDDVLNFLDTASSSLSAARLDDLRLASSNEVDQQVAANLELWFLQLIPPQKADKPAQSDGPTP